MLILNAIIDMKKAVATTTQTLVELIEEARGVSFPNKDMVLKSFEAMKIIQIGHVVHLKYDNRKMFEMKWNPYVMKTRGLVLDFQKEKLVMYPFDKFFELDEQPGSKLSDVKKATYDHGEDAEVTEKIDGSLIITRFHEGDFLVASSGALQGQHVNIAKSILEKDAELRRFIQDHSSLTIILEMKNTKFRQLVKYNEDSLTIIGMRNMDTLSLLSRREMIAITDGYKVQMAPSYSLTIEQMLKTMEDPNSSEMEGYILRVGDLMVKMKTKNFILANRFMGDSARNFNMLIESFNENRIAAIAPMISDEYRTAFDIGVSFIERYIVEKKQLFENMYAEFDPNLSIDVFVRQVMETYPKHKEGLISMKIGHFQSLGKTDIQFLKKYADYLGCTTHLKFAETKGVSAEEIEEKIVSGEIKTLQSFTTSNGDKKTIYIIHKWQFIDLDQIHYEQ